jgi:hypothetical protein
MMVTGTGGMSVRLRSCALDPLHEAGSPLAMFLA